MNAAMPDLSSLLGSLLSNPGALSGAINLLGGLLNGESKPEETEDTAGAESATDVAVTASASPTEDVPETASGEAVEDGSVTAGAFPKLPPPKPGRGCGRRKHLLLALRPYLSPERCRMLDLLVRGSDLLDLFRSTGRK